MPQVRFNIKQVKDKNKESLIYLIFNYNNSRLKLSTGKTAKPKYWNETEHSVRAINNYPKHSDVNEKLQKFRYSVETAFNKFDNEGIDPSPSELKQEALKILNDKEPKKRTDFWDIFEQFVQSSKGRVVEDVIKDYNSLKKHLNAFEEFSNQQMSFRLINYAFYQQFVHFLTYETKKPNEEKGLATNTIGKQIKNLKAFLNYCFRVELVERFDLSNFKTITEDTDAIYLTEDEISSIYKLDLKENPELIESRDLLVLGCQIGLRSSDLFRLTPGMINDDKIKIKMQKSSKNVIIPLQIFATEIIQKYKGDFPNKNNKNTFNTDIKKIGNLAKIKSEIIITQKKGTEKIDKSYKKYQLISSHTCRRSFCTNQYLKGVPTVLLMKISGHSTEKAFLRYIKIDEEMAATKLKEMWLKNE